MPARSVAWVRIACSTVVLTGLIAGCASSPDAAATADPAQPTVTPSPYKNASRTATPPTAGQSAAAPKTAAGPAQAAYPSDAKYTILCVSFPGSGSAAAATSWKDKLVRDTNRKEFYVVHEENGSTIYFGYYREYQRDVNAREYARADADMTFVKNLTSDGQPLFARSLFVPLPAADPAAPPEYDLARLDANRDVNDPDRKYWSIAIAAYTADAEPIGADAGKNRKQLAVESVMEARKQGIEAYYYHGPNVSSVCIGSWPRRAMREQMTDNQIKKGDNGDPIILSDTRFSDKMMQDIENSGKRVTVVQPKNEIDDPSLLATWKQYPQYLVNGQLDVDVVTDPTTGEKKRQSKTSFLFEIPLAQGGGASMLTAGRNTQAAQPEQAPETNPLLPGQGFGGRLRSARP